MRIEECIEYAKAMKPKIAFPVHDGMLKPEARGFAKFLSETFLTHLGIEFKVAVEDTVFAF